MIEFSRHVRPLFLITGGLLALSAHAISWASAMAMEPDIATFEQTSASNVAADIASSITDVPLPDFDARSMSPASAILAQHDAMKLSIVPAMCFAPPALRLSFAMTVNEPVDEHNNRLLHVASRSGNLAALWQLLEFGAQPLVRNRFHKSPLDVAFRGNAQAHAAIEAILTSPNHSLTDAFFKRPQASETMVN